MDKTLVNKSDYFWVKSKFFINRVLTYFTFLLIPLWIQYSIEIHPLLRLVVITMYMIFMVGQWYLLGKEVDHRFKIYFLANSSIDRVICRVLTGGICFIILFTLFSLVPEDLQTYLFWTFFTILGLFYSWPTRGKIIEESMSTQFGEYKFLDRFEKTMLYLTIVFFIVSIPKFPQFQNIDALKLYFDPKEYVHNIYWNFLHFMFLPFKTYSKFFNLSWSLFIYFWGVGIYLLCSYAIFRFFFSRRLAILGVFSIVSSWSLVTSMEVNLFGSINSALPVIWIWVLLWSGKSETYRSGFLVGLFSFMMTLINPIYGILYLLSLVFHYFILYKEKSAWLKKQFLKYSSLGLFLILIALFSHSEKSIYLNSFEWQQFGVFVKKIFTRKSFFSLAPIGVLVILAYYLLYKLSVFRSFFLEKYRLKELIFIVLVLLLMGLSLNKIFFGEFFVLWLLAFFSLVPVEWLFQSLSRLRSKRNLILVLYILVCLLDSHFEERVKIIGNLFLSDEVLKYIHRL